MRIHNAVIGWGEGARRPGAPAQHVLPYPAGYVGVREGSVLSAADSFRITLFGRGGHGSMPQATEDPVVLAAMCVIRLQTIVSREIAATTPAVVTVGKIAAGTGPTIMPDTATVELNVRTYDEQTRTRVLDAIRRCVDAEAVASGSPRAPLIERLTEFPPTVNDAEVVRRLRSAFAARFGDDLHTLDLQTASEDFSRIPDAWGTPYAYWGVGGTDPAAYAEAEERGTVGQDIPVNHSPPPGSRPSSSRRSTRR